MNFCEDCREKKNWPDSAVVADQRCEQCGQPKKCYDVPSVMLIPEADRTLEQKLVLKVMQEAFRDKAENLIITTLEGRVDHVTTIFLRQILVTRGKEVDWFATYQARLRAQEGHREFERAERDRR